MTTFIKSGSTRLDQILGGGWCQGRLVCLSGESQSGKSFMMAITAANFKKANPNGLIWICDAEEAFSPEYAETLGLYPEDYEFIEATTIEEFQAALADILDKKVPKGIPAAIFLDSLDTLFTDKQKDTKIADEKGFEDSRRAADVGKTIKKSVAMLAEKNVLLFFIQQVRSRIDGYGGVAISGGKGPEFWASQRVHLKQIKILQRMINGKEMTYGVKLKAITKKCRFEPHDQEAIFDIIFGVGIDDVRSCLEWLRDLKKLDMLPADLTSVEQKDKKGNVTYKLLERDQQIIDRIFKMEVSLQDNAIAMIQALTNKVWAEMKEINRQKNKVLGLGDRSAPTITDEESEAIT